MDITGTMDTDRYIQTLDDNLWPVFAKYFPDNDFIFQDDNAPCHNSYRAIAWKRENAIPCLNWPS